MTCMSICTSLGNSAHAKRVGSSRGRCGGVLRGRTLIKLLEQVTVLQSRESPRGMRRSGAILWMNGEFIRSHTWVHAFPLADSKGKTITLTQTCLYYPCYKIRLPNEILLISRPLVFMRNKSCRVQCLTYVRSMGGSPGHVSEEPVR